jgi:hypothetical protein
MALDPNIALGVKSLELPNPLARYGQLAQIQNAQNQNQLAQYQLGSAQREQESINALNQAYAKAYDPKTGQINADALRQSLASGGFGSKLPAVEKGLLELGKLKTETQKAETDLVDARLKQARSFLETINPLDPRAPEQYIAWHQSNHADPVLGPVLKARGSTPEQSMARIQQAIQAGPQAFADLLNASKLGTEKFIELNKPVTFAQDTGGGGRVMTRAGLGGPATLVPGSDYTKTQTFADINAAATLKFNKDKFAWEKANPTLSIQQTPTGYVAVNTTNGMAIPVLYGQDGFQAAGGAQPATAPGASMMRQPPAALPGQRTPAIPGMASVLDQTAAPAVAPMALPVGTPGTPVMGKQSELKPIPSNINLAILKNNQSIQQIDETIKLLQQNPSSTGVKGYLPGFALNRMDPSGVEARAGVADIGSLVLHDRSGAAVTAAEAPRLVPFIPLPTDDNATVIKKLTRMRNIAAQEQTGLTETYGKDQGYAPNPTVGRAGGAPLSAQQIPPIYATNGKERIMSIDGGQTWTPANK